MNNCSIDIKPPTGFPPASRVYVYHWWAIRLILDSCPKLQTRSLAGVWYYYRWCVAHWRLTQKSIFGIYLIIILNQGAIYHWRLVHCYWDDWPDGKSYSHKELRSAKLRWRPTELLVAIAAKHHLNPPSSLYLFFKDPFPQPQLWDGRFCEGTGWRNKALLIIRERTLITCLRDNQNSKVF